MFPRRSFRAMSLTTAQVAVSLTISADTSTVSATVNPVAHDVPTQARRADPSKPAVCWKDVFFLFKTPFLSTAALPSSPVDESWVQCQQNPSRTTNHSFHHDRHTCILLCKKPPPFLCCARELDWCLRQRRTLSVNERFSDTDDTQSSNQAAHDSPDVLHCHRLRVPFVALLNLSWLTVSAFMPPPAKHHRNAVISKRSNLHAHTSFALTDLHTADVIRSSGSFFTLPASHPTHCGKPEGMPPPHTPPCTLLTQHASTNAGHYVHNAPRHS